MKTLWFKSEFVPDILAGRKTDTIRRASSRLPVAGDIVAFSVGPRPAFAIAVILEVLPVAPAEIASERLQTLARCGTGTDGPLDRLTFALQP